MRICILRYKTEDLEESPQVQMVENTEVKIDDRGDSTWSLHIGEESEKFIDDEYMYDWTGWEFDGFTYPAIAIFPS